MDKLTISRILVENKYLLPVTKTDAGVHVVDIPKAAGILNDLFQQKLNSGQSELLLDFLAYIDTIDLIKYDAMSHKDLVDGFRQFKFSI